MLVYLWYVKEDGQADDWQHIAEQEAAMTHLGIAVIVIMSQTHGLKTCSTKWWQKYGDLVSFNGDWNCEEDTTRHADVRQTIKDGVESDEDVTGEVQGDGCQEDAARKKGCVRYTETPE